MDKIKTTQYQPMLFTQNNKGKLESLKISIRCR